MPPGVVETLQPASSRVLLAGVLAPASVTLRRDADDTLVVERIEPLPAGTQVEHDHVVVPAPLDLHFHGAGGHVVPPAGDPAAIDRAVAPAAAALAADGAATRYEWIATLPVPSRPPADPVAHLGEAAAAIADAPGTWCAGLRIEGLFLNPSRAGVWPPETFVAPDAALLDRLVDAAAAAGTPLRIIDVAPELPGALELIAHARERGIIVSLAHTDATWEEAVAAIDAGATLATHTWNAMRPVLHRDPGVVAASLVDPRVTCELICDGVHLHPGTLSLSIAATAARGGWVAISDASPFAGAPAGTYDWAGTQVRHDGVALRDAAGHLAGSASLLDIAPRVLEQAGVPPLDAVIAMGAAPRRVLDPSRELGLQVGDPAWLVELPARSADAQPPA